MGLDAAPECAFRSDRHRIGQSPAAHISERLGVDRVVAMAGAQQFEKVEPALRAGRAEPGKAVVANMRAEPVRRLVARPGVVDRDPGGTGQTRAQYLARLAEETPLAADQQPHYLPLGDFDADRFQERHEPRHGHLALMRSRRNRMATGRSTRSWTRKLS